MDVTKVLRPRARLVSIQFPDGGEDPTVLCRRREPNRRHD